MKERDLWWKIVVVGALCAIGFASIWPLDTKLKFGIDLQGGYSLLYEIDDTGLSGDARQTLSERVMRVLRERVDPKGVFNLVWRPVGHNRLEIQMPRPSRDIRDLRTAYERHQQEIQATIVRRSDIVAAVARPPEQRAGAFEKLLTGVPERRALLEAASAAYDAFHRARVEYDERVRLIERDNLKYEEVLAAISRPPPERPQALAPLIRGIPARQALLEAAARAWDEQQSVQATTRPGAATTQPGSPEMTRLASARQALEAAVARVLEANVDPDKLTDGATIDQVIKREEEFDTAVANVLATNVDLGRLLAVLEIKPGDPTREEELKKIRNGHPALASVIGELTRVSDRLKRQRRGGEGRLEDPADLQRLLRGAGVLEFRILPEFDRTNPDKFASYVETLETRGPRKLPGEENYQWFQIEDPVDFLKVESRQRLEREFDNIKRGLSIIVERYGDKYYALAEISPNSCLVHRPGEPDWALRAARFQRDQFGKPAIGFELDERGGDKFATLTRINKGRQLAIFLDDQLISHATIRDVIRTQGEITGSFTVQEVQEMVKKLEAGSLPRKLKDPPISVRSIGPSLGEANRAAGLKSAQYASVAVALSMIGYYYYAGGIAVIATVMNILFTVAAMASMGATLTLPGIAGLVLAIGMSVDANVLINERIREELAKGTAMRMAIKLGYERAFSAILDSNVTTILTSLILYMLGSEEIRGFGLTLGLGVLINLFTAYFVTRMFFELMSILAVPFEVARYPVYFAAGASAFGAGLYGLGYWWNAPELREHSVLIAFGKTLVFAGPAVVGLQALMFGARGIHQSIQRRSPRPRLPMQHWLGVPNIDWHGMRYPFYALSIALTIGGAVLFFSMDPDKLYDIEFLGGTAAQIDLRKPGSLNQTALLERLQKSAQTLRFCGERLAQAGVSGSGGSWTISTPGVTAARIEPVIRAVMKDELSEVNPVRYSDPADEAVSVTTRDEAGIDLEAMRNRLKDLAARFREAAENIASAQIQAVQIVGAGEVAGRSFEVVTREKSKDIVVAAIMDNLQDELDIQPRLTFRLMDDKRNGGVPYFAIRDVDPRKLGLPLGETELAGLDLRGWKGGVAIILDDISPPQSVPVLQERLRKMRLQPGFEEHGWRESQVFGLAPAAQGSDLCTRVMVVVADENYPLEDEQGGQSATWVSELAEPEVALVQAALERQASLSQVTQFDEQVSDEAKTNATIAVILSWLVIIIYLWFRFGRVRWGLAAVAALVHDALVGLSAIALSFYIADTTVGRWLLIDKFRIDLSVVAALLTIIGYSVNDTIVVFDRVRENRGRQPDVSAELVNNSISQTLSRTILTVLTVFITVVIMYIWGGPGIHAFNYVMIAGLATGSYSSIFIASQLLIRRRLAAAG